MKARRRTRRHLVTRESTGASTYHLEQCIPWNEGCEKDEARTPRDNSLFEETSHGRARRFFVD